MNVDVAIKNGLVVTDGASVHASIGVRDGTICALVDDGADLTAREEEVDATGLVVLPGVIEPHCHFWDPGPTHREDWGTGTRAAAAGGVTTCIEMPLSDPPTVDAAAFALKQERAAAQSVIDYALWGGIIPASLENLSERLEAMRTLGAVAYKAFMCWSATDYPPVDDGVLLEAMQALAARGWLLGLHAENDAIITHTERRLRAQGRCNPQAYLESRPEVAEIEAIRRAVGLAEITGARLYIVHMSTAAGAQLIREAKSRGVQVCAETAPQYLTLDARALLERGPYAKCAPPLRSHETVERLWSYILDGTIDTIGSDHAPFSAAEKEPGMTNIWHAPNGIPGIQTMLPLVLSECLHRRGVSLPRVAALFSTNAARIFGLYPRKGVIRVGSDADFTLVDVSKEWRIDDADLLYKNRWSPYHGMQVRGQVDRTIVRGRTVYQDGLISVQSGYGRQVIPHDA